jgi:uncharacterized membrane protein YvbJ
MLFSSWVSVLDSDEEGRRSIRKRIVVVVVIIIIIIIVVIIIISFGENFLLEYRFRPR